MADDDKIIKACEKVGFGVGWLIARFVGVIVKYVAMALEKVRERLER